MSEQSATTPVRRFRVTDLTAAKREGRKVTMLTAYDLPTARIFDAAGVDLLLVGDSMGDNMLGHENTIPVTLDEIIPAARAVARGVKRAMVVVDLPFGSYEAHAEQALASAVRVLKETGAHAVKFEGGQRVVSQVEACTRAGIPVIGHLGFTPQSENILGGKKIQGRGDSAAQTLVSDAVALQEAGAVAVVLEMVPAPVAAQVTEVLKVPTIGIGAGPSCDGQVLVWLDMAGMGDWSPRFAKRYANIGEQLQTAARAYVEEVTSGVFPDDDHSYSE